MPDAPDYTLLSDVNIVGSVTLNVNVVGSVTLNVNVTNASIDIRIIAQTVGIQILATFQTLQNQHKVFYAEGQLTGNPDLGAKWAQTLIDYTVPAGKTLLVESITVNVISRLTLTWYNVYGSGASYNFEYVPETFTDFFVYVGASIVAKFSPSRGATSIVYTPTTPLRISAGSTLKIVGLSAPVGVWCAVTVVGYEI
jgi:hypothetical protein